MNRNHKSFLLLCFIALLGVSNLVRAEARIRAVEESAPERVSEETPLSYNVGTNRPADPADQAITDKVMALLAAEARIKGEIKVSTRQGTVSLSGKLASPSMVYRAVALVRDVEGVKRVDESRLEATMSAYTP